ncbi:hypothetical protein PaecuDRAFT_0483 [Paenibacillus curdlanolyticus YK9]|uniref:Uncharacterized protein n=1 Tax=Paenibacillus curdlanolyticus YK9 TaxID=717606 RepID=E0I3V8_9BACL|nr:hypothetical protein [Paenibacillus curdlanolyticus]EFM12972.1 hypothetical protein PaecuDRAFT_0483 [Paenibacillus curdlanolyticus YK9]
MRKLIYDKAMHFSVLTYEKLAGKGELLISIINELLDTFVKPHNIELKIDIQKYDLRYTKMKLNDKNLKKVYSLLEKGEVLSLIMNDNPNGSMPFYPEDDDDDRAFEVIPRIVLGVNCYDAEPVPVGKYNEITLSLSEKLFEGTIPIEIQEQMIAAFKSIIKKTNGVTGSISYDTRVAAPKGATYFEGFHNILPFQNPSFNDHIRGYFWANWLSASHIERLGGIEGVSSHSPCYKIEIMEVNGQQGAYLQLTPDINAYDDEKLSALRTYLLPLLFFGDPQSPKNNTYKPGEVHRLVER